jgi:hypothetical protein
MIQFCCWYCGKSYVVAEKRVGERLRCTCRNTLRVPRRTGGNSRVKTLADWAVEAVVYGGGGALLGLGLGVLILSQAGRLFGFLVDGWMFVGAFTAAGFLFGLLGGERGINWVGRKIRDRENR